MGRVDFPPVESLPLRVWVPVVVVVPAFAPSQQCQEHAIGTFFPGFVTS